MHACRNLRGRKCMMTDPMLAFGREPQQTGGRIFKDHNPPLKKNKREEVTCKRMQFIGARKLVLLPPSWIGDAPRMRGSPRPEAGTTEASTWRSSTHNADKS